MQIAECLLNRVSSIDNFKAVEVQIKCLKCLFIKEWNRFKAMDIKIIIKTSSSITVFHRFITTITLIHSIILHIISMDIILNTVTTKVICHIICIFLINPWTLDIFNQINSSIFMKERNNKEKWKNRKKIKAFKKIKSKKKIKRNLKNLITDKLRK